MAVSFVTIRRLCGHQSSMGPENGFRVEWGEGRGRGGGREEGTGLGGGRGGEIEATHSIVELGLAASLTRLNESFANNRTAPLG